MSQSFDHKVGIVTGAASGLGRAIAKKLSAEGASLALFDLNADELATTQKDLAGHSEAYIVDITDESAVREAIGRVAATFGRIDLLINSAGITGKTNLKSHETATEDLLAVFNVNFMGSYLTSKYVLPVMLRNNYGRILHMASIAGKEGNAGMLSYSSSKAAVIGMTKVQGKEYAGTGITINALARHAGTAGEVYDR
jgi:2-dehydro-3-deoxy-L-rhamnonate dehydrogenase (NAD+)